MITNFICRRLTVSSKHVKFLSTGTSRLTGQNVITGSKFVCNKPWIRALSGSLGSIDYSVEPLSSEHRQVALALLQRSFRVNEPLSRSLTLTEEENEAAISDMVDHAILQGLSFVALHDDKAVGARISSCVQRGVDSFKPTRLADYSQKMCWILELLSAMDTDIFTLLPDAQTIFKFEMISVDANYMRQGIAQSLIDHTLAMVAKHQLNPSNLKQTENDIANKRPKFDYFATVATSIRTQTLYEKKLNYKVLKSIQVEKWSMEDPKTGKMVHPFKNMPADNKLCKLLAKNAS